MDRTTIIAGPAIVKFDSQVFYTDGDITATPTKARFDINTSMHGKVDERLDTVLWEISFTPAGQWSAGHIGVLWPYGNPTIGSSMLGATDNDVVIQTLAGREITFNAGCVRQMPDLNLSAVQTPIGQVGFACIGANDTDMSDAAKFAVDQASAFADASFDRTDIKTVPYTAAWGAVSPWDDFETEGGWTISFETGDEVITTDSAGIVDIRLTSVAAMAKCMPVGVSESDVLDLLKVQGSGVARGASMLSNANDLVIDGGSGNPKFTLKNASPVEGRYQFGNGATLRHGELGFTAIRSFAAGVAGAFFTVEVGT